MVFDVAQFIVIGLCVDVQLKKYWLVFGDEQFLKYDFICISAESHPIEKNFTVFIILPTININSQTIAFYNQDHRHNTSEYESLSEQKLKKINKKVTC